MTAETKFRDLGEKDKLSGKGHIYSFAKNENGSSWVAIIILKEGVKMTAGLTDFDKTPAIGQEVEMVTRKLREADEDRGLFYYGPKFRPSISQNS